METKFTKKIKKAGRPPTKSRADLRELAQKLLDWLQEKPEHVFVGKFAIKQEMTAKQLQGYAMHCPELKKAMEMAKQKEENMWLEEGRGGKPVMAIFTLKTRHGYREPTTAETRVVLPEINVIIQKKKKK